MAFGFKGLTQTTGLDLEDLSIWQAISDYFEVG